MEETGEHPGRLCGRFARADMFKRETRVEIRLADTNRLCVLANYYLLGSSANVAFVKKHNEVS